MADLSGVRVVIERPCDVCEGRGYVRPEQDMLKRRECGNCEGSGQATDTIALDELADWLVARVPVALIPRPELEAVVASLQKSITDAAEKAQGRSDPDTLGSWLRVVQEGAEALRSITELLVRGER